MINWTCKTCGNGVNVTSPLAALDTVCPKCQRRLLEKESPPLFDSAAEACSAARASRRVSPATVPARWIGAVVGTFAGAGIVWLIMTHGGPQERALMFGLGGGLMMAVCSYVGYRFLPRSYWRGYHDYEAWQLVPHNKYDEKYLAGFFGVLGCALTFLVGLSIDPNGSWTPAKALALLDNSSHEHGPKLNKDYRSPFPSQEQARIEAHRRKLRQDATSYLLFCAAGGLGAVVLGSLVGIHSVELVAEFMEVMRLRRG